MELGADAGVKDSDGQLCISAMIVRMAPVVREDYPVSGGLLRLYRLIHSFDSFVWVFISRVHLV